MPPPEIKKYLYDVQQACIKLSEFTNGKSLSDYLGDALLRSAVERQFEIAGEALSQMLKRDPSMESVITDCRRIIAFRNILIHGYADIQDETVWGILEKDLPILIREVTDLVTE